MAVRLDLNQNNYQMMQSGVSRLFGGFSSGSTGSLASLVSEYQSIRSGAYYKAAKKYFSNLQSTGTASSVSSKTEDTTVSERKKNYDDPLKYRKVDTDSKELTATQKAASKTASDAKSMTDALDSLTASGNGSVFQKNLTYDSDGNMDYSYDRDKVSTALTNFVNSYNAVLSNGTSAGSYSLQTSISSMKGTNEGYSKALSEIGIKVGTDGKLSIDSAALKTADLGKAEDLFQTKNGYGDQMTNYAKQAQNSALFASSYSSGYDLNGNYAALQTSNLFGTSI